jgi:hypothetical protein
VTEAELLVDIQTSFSRGPVRLFRSNSGVAWQGTIAEHTPQRIVLLSPRAIRVGCVGMSDLIGWSAGGIYTAIETKSNSGRVRPEQAEFINAVRAAGGRAGVARSLADAELILTSHP